MDSKELSQYIVPMGQSVANLDCSTAFDGLTAKEKLYTYYLSQASWAGGLICLVQCSPEAPAIFSILHDMFRTNGVENLKGVAIGDCDFTEDEWKALLMYTAAMFSYMGNYKGYGDTKIIPGLPVDKLERLIAAANFSGHKSKEGVLQLWNEIKGKVYSLSEREKQLGLGDKGITTYFSGNCTHDDAELVNRFMKANNLEACNTRCFKTLKDNVVHYEIRSASIEKDTEPVKTHNFEDCLVTITRGDYSPLLERVNQILSDGVAHASNETEEKMIECYIEHFRTGSVDAHKNGSRYWVKDKGPIVETYIGFIERYKDPAGTRAEFRGFVSVVNKAMSAKFSTLVEQAPDLLSLLPWPREFEKDTFLKPDFTSLDVVTFAGSVIPAGTNVPNYDEIKQSEGFKNLSLGNVLQSGQKASKLSFVGEADEECLKKYMDQAFEVQVGLHELLGHGSGKLFQKLSDGTKNYPCDLKHPLTNELIESAYEPGESFDSVFTKIKSSYEECRAECVGLLLSLDKSVLKIFGHEGSEAAEITYANWLSMVRGGFRSILMYNPGTETWMQAHAQARFVILNVLLEAGENLVTIEETVSIDGTPDLLLHLDRIKVDSVGRNAIKDFLLKLQIYKSTADVQNAKELYQKYSTVHDKGPFKWLKWMDIVRSKRKPAEILNQVNLTLTDDGSVNLKSYEASIEGYIQAWIERFSDNKIYQDLESCRESDKIHFRDN